MIESEEESNKDSIIEAFNLKNEDQTNMSEESIEDLKAYIKNLDDEELESELPRRIFTSMRKLANHIAKLDKDEYGDYIYREKDENDRLSQRFKKASNILKFWLNLLKSTNRYRINSFNSIKNEKPTTLNQNTQTDSFKPMKIKTASDLRKNFKKRNSVKSPDMVQK